MLSPVSPTIGNGAEQQLAFEEKRQAAARNAKKTKGEGKGRNKVIAGQGNCPQCRGLHGECTACPNTAAVKDASFDEEKASSARTLDVDLGAIRIDPSSCAWQC